MILPLCSLNYTPYNPWKSIVTQPQYALPDN